MEVTVKVVATDHPDLISLVAQLNTFFDEEWGADVAGSYQTHHRLADMACAVVAYDGSQAIGCGCWKQLADGRPEIKRMFVQPEIRGGGVASQILGALEADIKKGAFQSVVLETGAEMTGAIRFYEKHGYQIIPNYGEFIGDELCVCMEKRLTKG